MRRHMWAVVLAGWLGLGGAISAAQGAIPWETELEVALQKAAQSQRLVLLHFWDDNCVPCAKMEHHVFRNPEVARVLPLHYVPVKIHVRRHPELKEKYGIRAWPTDVILTPSGQEVYRGVPRPDPRHFLATLSNVAVHVRSRRPVQRRDAESNWETPKSAPQVVRNSKFAPSEPPSGAPQVASPQSAAPSSQVVQNRFAPEATRAAGLGVPTANSRPTPGPAPGSRAPSMAGQSNPYVMRPAGPYAQQLVDPRGQSKPNPAAPSVPGPATSSSFDPTASQVVPTGPGAAPVGPPPPAAAASPAPSAPSAASSNFAATRAETVPARPAAPAPTAPPARSAPPRPSRPSRPTLPQTPSAHPPIGLDGYCPVTLVTREEWKKGNAQYGAIHRGRTYLFVDRAAQRAFLADPDRYAPMLSGLDVVELIDNGRHVVGQRRHGVFHRDRIYLFASEASLAKFFENPDRYHQQAIEILSRSR